MKNGFKIKTLILQDLQTELNELILLQELLDSRYELELISYKIVETKVMPVLFYSMLF